MPHVCIRACLPAWDPGGTLAVILMKLGMYLMCRGSRDPSVRAFALDHINDVLVNSVGLAGAPDLLPSLLAARHRLGSHACSASQAAQLSLRGALGDVRLRRLHHALHLAALMLTSGGCRRDAAEKVLLDRLCSMSLARARRAGSSATVAAWGQEVMTLCEHARGALLLGRAGALLGDRVAGWLDPLVAAGMSVWLIWAWGAQCYANVMNLARAPLPRPLQQWGTAFETHC